MPSEAARRRKRLAEMTDEERSMRDFRRAVARQNRLETMSPAEREAAKEKTRAYQRAYRARQFGVRPEGDDLPLQAG